MLYICSICVYFYGKDLRQYMSHLYMVTESNTAYMKICLKRCTFDRLHFSVYCITSEDLKQTYIRFKFRLTFSASSLVCFALESDRLGCLPDHSVVTCFASVWVIAERTPRHIKTINISFMLRRHLCTVILLAIIRDPRGLSLQET